MRVDSVSQCAFARDAACTWITQQRHGQRARPCVSASLPLLTCCLSNAGGARSFHGCLFFAVLVFVVLGRRWHSCCGCAVVFIAVPFCSVFCVCLCVFLSRVAFESAVLRFKVSARLGALPTKAPHPPRRCGKKQSAPTWRSAPTQGASKGIHARTSSLRAVSKCTSTPARAQKVYGDPL